MNLNKKKPQKPREGGSEPVNLRPGEHDLDLASLGSTPGPCPRGGAQEEAPRGPHSSQMTRLSSLSPDIQGAGERERLASKDRDDHGGKHSDGSRRPLQATPRAAFFHDECGVCLSRKDRVRAEEGGRFHPPLLPMWFLHKHVSTTPERASLPWEG